ncbi:MAG: hypothetical protein IPJ65_05235 [Archangiaceae bacterium]|nr:hypothetical protein [Archangiaceae bacterium]
MSAVQVFVGPSLPPRVRPQLDGAVVHPPIKRGDLGRLLAEGLTPPCTLAIIDGEFAQSLAVSPRELLEAMRRGFTVCGASSMGALRAAELHTEGMRGVGRIFEMYRDGEVMSDDEVGIVFDADSQRPLSEPLVNTRCAAAKLVAAGALDAEQAAQIVGVAQGLPYPDRHYRRIAQQVEQRHGAALAAKVELFKPFDQKRDDALELLRQVT